MYVASPGVRKCDSVTSSVFPAVTRAGPVLSTVHAEILHLQSRL